MNLYFSEPSFQKLTSAHFHAWQLGLKTGQYYLRSRPSRDAIKFTLDVGKLSRDSSVFDHMNEKNYTQAEIDAMKKRKKRKINEISSN